ncbi:ABC transporter ATP-binding protein [Amorphus orientalis]|uniref:Branched-chain amino acid transport system ATP-binding protein n=1 Tax=Amorphus orientalis TaxID=649198 RepID=A0AAE4AS71_9HYPH|nr:ABC transporter ATP-binding protein [Amorphus orientalis]MDQ0314715.1 branched-chain amino acid transport system ATP-binding protein [Amorphus orientalis]
MSEGSTTELLRLENLTAGYGDGVALDGVSLAIASGESLAVLGRNGVGKTTLLETIMGNTRLHKGKITLAGRDITRLPPHARVKAGLGWVPQEREVFPSLTVEEHLTVIATPGKWTVERVYEAFPRLGERRRNYGNQLSGGEQQMLAIGRALMTNPRLLLLDEPMEGLAPIVVEDLSARVVALSESEGLTCIVVEQHPIVALALSRNAIVLERGQIVHTARSEDLAGDHETIERLLGVGEGGADEGANDAAARTQAG